MRDVDLANPGRRSIALADELRVLPHVHFELVLLRLPKRFAQFVADRILRAGHAARGIGHCPSAAS